MINETINQTFIEALSSQLLGGQCNVLSGMVMGSIFSIKILFGLLVMVILFNSLNMIIKEAFQWIVKKVKERKKKNE